MRPGIARSLGARTAALACLAAALTACQPGSGGKLQPSSGQQTGEKGPYGGGSVKLVVGGIEAQVSGDWHSRRGANGLDIQVTYRNLGQQSVVLNAANFRGERGKDRGEIDQVVDITGMDLSDDRTDNDNATQVINVYERLDRGTIQLKPGESRAIQVSVIFPDGVAEFAGGQDVRVAVPVANGMATATFKTKGSWF